jgi:16S rRNA (guanine527-N7)-methyltransferase
VRLSSLPNLGERYGLDDRQLGQLDAVLNGLATDEHAPTTVRDARLAVDVHLADSLTALELSAVCAAGTIADLGAGAGFPGLALAVAAPEIEVNLVESQARKCAFMERLRTAAGVDNARIVHSRIEEWSEGLGHSDVVVARALAPQPVVLEYAAPLLEMGGVLVDWRGRRNVDEETDALFAAEHLGLRRLEIRHIEPYEGARDHHLHVFEKAAETPSRFPRRAGVARKRPLGLRAAKDRNRR